MSPGRRSFSWWSMVQDIWPSFPDESKDYAEISPAQMDSLLKYHLAIPQPRYLDANSLMISGVCDHIKVAERTLKSLHKYGYALPPPPPPPPAQSQSSSSSSSSTLASIRRASEPATTSSTPNDPPNPAADGTTPAAAAQQPAMTVNTHIIDKQMPSRLATISLHAHRRLVSLLFFWEEECNRWRMLDREEAEILEAMRAHPVGGDYSADLRLALQRVRLQRVLLPSQRAEGAPWGRGGNAARQEAPPSYY